MVLLLMVSLFQTRNTTKVTDNNSTEDPPRAEQNISNKNGITQTDEGRKSLAQDKTCFACNFTVHHIIEQRREIY